MNRIAFVLSRMASASLLSACFLLGMSSCGKEAARSSSITRCFVKDSCATLSCGKEKLPIDVLYPTIFWRSIPFCWSFSTMRRI